MPVRTSSLPAIDDEEATRWFDETFASSVKPIRETTPETFENFMQDVDDRAEHGELLATFARVRRPAATARVEIAEDGRDD